MSRHHRTHPRIKLAWRCVRAVKSDDQREIDAIEAQEGGSLSDILDSLWYEAGVSRNASTEWARLESSLKHAYCELTDTEVCTGEE